MFALSSGCTTYECRISKDCPSFSSIVVFSAGERSFVVFFLNSWYFKGAQKLGPFSLKWFWIQVFESTTKSSYQKVLRKTYAVFTQWLVLYLCSFDWTVGTSCILSDNTIQLQMNIAGEKIRTLQFFITILQELYMKLVLLLTSYSCHFIEKISTCLLSLKLIIIF